MNTLTNDRIKQFHSLVVAGLQSWMDAGAIVSKAIDDDPDFPDKVAEKHPEIGINLVLAFDRIGRKQLHPKLILNDSPGFVRLRQLPYDVQVKLLSEPVGLLTKTEAGWEELRVDVANLTAFQAKQVFSREGVRPAPAQRAWLADQVAKSSVPKAESDSPYRVVGKQLVIMEPCKLSVSEIARIIAQMES